MYAVILSGGKQYRVKEGQYLNLDKIEAEIESTICFKHVLLINKDESIKIGNPYIDKCKVTAIIEDHNRNDKVNIIKFKRRKHHMKHMGHRQWFTRVRIINILQ